MVVQNPLGGSGGTTTLTSIPGANGGQYQAIDSGTGYSNNDFITLIITAQGAKVWFNQSTKLFFTPNETHLKLLQNLPEREVLGMEKLSVTNGELTLNPPNGCNHAEMQVQGIEGQTGLKFRVDGLDPAAFGKYIYTNGYFEIESSDAVSNFRALALTNDGIDLIVTYVYHRRLNE